MDPYELWSSPYALRLSDAWWAFGDPYAKDRYRETHDRSGMFFREQLMHADLIDQISGGAFLALGFQVSPVVAGLPEIIPPLFFDRPDIDWAESTLRAYGRVYEGVKLIERPADPPGNSIEPEQDGRVIAEQAGGLIQQPAQEMPVIQVDNQKQRGRPAVAGRLREVVRELATGGHLDGISRKEQETKVRALARERHPHHFPKAEGFSAGL